MNRQASHPALELTILIRPAHADRPWCATLTGPPAQPKLEFTTPRALLAHLEWLISGSPKLR